MSFADDIDATTVETLRARGSLKWSLPGPDGYGAFVAEMDFGAAPPVLDALERLSRDAVFGYLPPAMELELAAACADWQQARYGWAVDPASIHPVADVLTVLGVAITELSRPGSPVILPTPAYMPFLLVPPSLGREVIQVPMHDEAGYFTLDLEAMDDAFRAGGDLVVFCNPLNPLGRVFSPAEMAGLTAVVERHGGRVFADEIHAPLVYRGSSHVPYASTSQTAAGHTITATSASKAWDLAGLKCAQVILTNDHDRAMWQRVGPFASLGASTPGVAANIAAFRRGASWLDDALDYLDGSRRLLAQLLAQHLPDVTYRPPDGTYLAWLDFRALPLGRSPGQLMIDRAKVVVVDGPAFGDAGAGALRFNFATPRPILRTMIERMADAVDEALR